MIDIKFAEELIDIQHRIEVLSERGRSVSEDLSRQWSRQCQRAMGLVEELARQAAASDLPSKEQSIVVVGDPASGFTFYGPFRNGSEACDWTDTCREDYWWVAPLQVPKEEN